MHILYHNMQKQQTVQDTKQVMITAHKSFMFGENDKRNSVSFVPTVSYSHSFPPHRDTFPGQTAAADRFRNLVDQILRRKTGAQRESLACFPLVAGLRDESVYEFDLVLVSE